MTQEDRELLVKDLCVRLPYDIIVRQNWSRNGREWHSDMDLTYFTSDCDSVVQFLANTDNAIPYLRPMSSMTEEEENEYRAINCYEGLFPRNEDAIDYVLSHHFDYRGLIEKGIALEAPEGMYKTE